MSVQLFMVFPQFLGFLCGSVVKNPPAKQETWVRSLDQESLLEKEMATHSSILAWKSPWTEKPGGLQSMELQKSWIWLGDHTTTTKQVFNTLELKHRNSV